MLEALRGPRVWFGLCVALALPTLLSGQRSDERSVRLFDNGNPGAVQNRPTRPTVFRLDQPTRITSITTYHWNGGSGSPAGSVALRSDAGEVFGPWPVRVNERVYWVAQPNLTVPPGVYTVVDSSPATWSQNAGSGGAGMAWVEGDATRATRGGAREREARPAPATSTPSPTDATSVLFRGALDDRWVRHAAAGGSFERDARLENGRGLVVSVPPNNGAGQVGLLSPKPLVWLDDFGRSASSALTFRFDPGRTTGFSVALTVPHNNGVAGNQPGSPSVLLTWTRTVDGASSKLELHVNPHAEGAFRTLELPPAAPREVVLTLRPYEVDWRIDGGPELVDEFPEARAGQGFHVYVFSNAPQWHAPVAMALEEVSLSQHRDPVKSQTTKIVGKARLFDGHADPFWEPVGVAGGDFARFARYGGGALVVDVPAGNGWGKTGLMSVQPALHVERRSDVAPYRFTVRTDPERTTGLVVALSATRSADMWSAEHLAWISLIRSESGTYELFLQQTPYFSWARPLTGSWNGQLTVTLASDGLRVSVPGGPSIRTPVGTRDGADYYLQVIAHPPRSSAPATLVLRSVLRERVLPVGLPAWQRWGFLSPEEFKPDALLRDLQSDLALAAIGDGTSDEGERE